MNDNNQTNNAFTNLSAAIADKTGIELDAANKVVTWLIMEGVLDAPVVHEEFGEQSPLGEGVRE